MGSRTCTDEIVKGSLLLAEIQDLLQCAVADVRNGHYEKLCVFPLRGCTPKTCVSALLSRTACAYAVMGKADIQKPSIIS